MPKQHYPLKNQHLARALRREQTPAEARLWSRLRNGNLMGIKFRRQVPVGPYIADFLSRQARLVVEADGGQHGEQEAYDATRTRFLEFRGYRVLRFWNHYILTDIDAVMEAIGEAAHWGVHEKNPDTRR
ncbi:endonuclease domain-containing protein [Maricaulis sp.]|uniref:endonuclease domain-containing protein n=1 Tax=Maricaulis sp. TaxID=1486257 RepID=UPI003A905411